MQYNRECIQFLFHILKKEKCEYVFWSCGEEKLPLNQPLIVICKIHKKKIYQNDDSNEIHSWDAYEYYISNTNEIM